MGNLVTISTLVEVHSIVVAKDGSQETLSVITVVEVSVLWMGMVHDVAVAHFSMAVLGTLMEVDVSKDDLGDRSRGMHGIGEQTVEAR